MSPTAVCWWWKLDQSVVFTSKWMYKSYINLEEFSKNVLKIFIFYFILYVISLPCYVPLVEIFLLLSWGWNMIFELSNLHASVGQKKTELARVEDMISWTIWKILNAFLLVPCHCEYTSYLKFRLRRGMESFVVVEKDVWLEVRAETG